MQIDWKAVAQSDGYKSLKSACYDDICWRHRRKDESRKHFRFVIDRAKSHAYRKGIPLEDVLNLWEAERGYWWVNYYSEYRQQKLPSGKPSNIFPEKAVTSAARDRWNMNDPVRRFKNIKDAKRREALNARKKLGKKPRWNKSRKEHEARMRKYRAEKLIK